LRNNGRRAVRDFDESNLTEAAVRRFDDGRDPRLRRILTSLVRHLHGFVRDVEPTEAEWFAAIDFLTRTGQTCDERRQEFILLSDVLGASMLVDAINHRRSDDATETTVLGPFYVGQAPEFALETDIADGVAGEPLYVEGVVRSTEGAALAGAIVDVWQSDDDGHYDLQLPGDGFRLRGRFRADDKGRFAFWSIMPRSYPIPTDGPVGELLAAAGQEPFRPAHVHFMIEAPGHERLVTHVFVAGDAHLDSDVVFGVKNTLVADFARRTRGVTMAGRPIEREHRYLRYDFSLQPSAARGQEAA
jgi:hydroxyquinol 1,2-dioxygenase